MKKWKNVVIRPADKGSKYFFLDREDYVKRVREHIHDADTFRTVNKEDAERRTKLAIINWINDHKDEDGMTDKIFNWVTPDDFCKPGNNYVNPKAHKPDKNYPGRLISTGCASAIKNLSALTSHELTKVKLKYAIQDLNQFLREIEKINKSGVLQSKSIIHVSFDIEAMFPSISKDVGLGQCRKHLDKRIDPIFSTECIIDALEITLDHNITEFDGETICQIKGTAMGPKNACAYADTAIDQIDRDVMEGSWSDPPLLWARYRDDVYVPWTYGPALLNHFHQWLNNRIPGIKFTMISSEYGTEFLDTYVYYKNGILHTKPYSKPCDDHSFLIPSSCHPSHTIRNIPYSTATRIYKIASEKIEYDKAKIDYEEHLKARGYCSKIIDEAFSKAETKERCEYFQVSAGKKTSNEKGTCPVPLVTDFNPALPNIGRILNKHKHILRMDHDLMKAVDPDDIFASFRGAKTLHDMLVHSRLAPSEEKECSPNETSHERVEGESSGGCFPCEKKCDLCNNFLKETTTVYSFHTNQVFSIRQNMNCTLENVVYIINDLKCNLSSVGCTANSLKVRFRNHKSHIKKCRRTCEVSSHFADNTSIHNLDKSDNKSFTNSLSSEIEVILIEQVDVSHVEDDPQIRLRECKKREWFWQNQLKTLRQYGGMNVREEKC